MNNEIIDVVLQMEANRLANANKETEMASYNASALAEQRARAADYTELSKQLTLLISGNKEGDVLFVKNGNTCHKITKLSGVAHLNHNVEEPVILQNA